MTASTSLRPDPERAALAQTLRITLLTALAAFMLDQGTKAWAVAAFDLDQLEQGERIAVAPLLNFTYAINEGVNFGLGASDSATQQYVLAALALAVSIGLGVWAVRGRRMALSLGCGATIGGALANALDRLLFDGVRDFINVTCCGLDNPYAFNVADVAIFAGALVIAIFAWNGDEPPRRDGETDVRAPSDH